MVKKLIVFLFVAGMGDWFFVGATGKNLFYQYARFSESVAYGCESCRLH